MIEPINKSATTTHSAPGARVVTILGMLFVSLMLWPIMWINPSYMVQGSSAEELYHIPTIERFAHQLPAPDYSDYASATAPGYHTILAVPRSLGMGYSGIRMLASLWTLALVGVLLWVVAKRFGFGALLLVLPFTVSNYVLFPGVWLLPDNAGWLGVLLIFLLALRSHAGVRTQMLAGAILFLLVYLRQVHIWAAAPIWLGAWLGSREQTPSIRGFFSPAGERFSRATIALVFTLPAFALLAIFIKIWGGLVPPTFKGEHHGPNPATPGFILFQLAVLSVFFSPILLVRLRTIARPMLSWIVAAVIIGAVVGLAPESTFSLTAGRFGGWWGLIGKLPDVMDRSPLFAMGSIAGAVAAVVWGSMLDRRDAWIFAGTLLAFALSQTANLESWQRYHEPMLMMMILILLTRSPVLGSARRGLLIGSVLLACMLGSITALQLREQRPRGITDERVELLQKRTESAIPRD